MKPKGTELIRWQARASSTLILGLFILYFVYAASHQNKIVETEHILLILFPIGYMVGLIWGWWQEGIGGSLALGSLLLFSIAKGITNIYTTLYLLLLAVPCLLFIISWWKSR